jgi:hypothetical protein
VGGVTPAVRENRRIRARARARLARRLAKLRERTARFVELIRYGEATRLERELTAARTRRRGGCSALDV